MFKLEYNSQPRVTPLISEYNVDISNNMKFMLKNVLFDVFFTLYNLYELY